MNTFKRITVALSVAILPLMLFSFGTLMSLHQVLGSPTTIKQALHDSGIYGALMDEALTSASRGLDGTTSAIPANNPDIQQVIQEAVPSSYIEQQSNGVIDSIYSWLHADSDSLKVAVDLQDAQSKLADGLAGYTTNYLNGLPTCTTPTDAQAISEDPLHASCVPAGFDTAAAAEKVRAAVANNPDVLPSTTLTTDTATTTEGEATNKQIEALPALYNQIQSALYASAILAVLCTIAIIFLSGTRRSGLKRVAIISVTVGVISSLLAWGASYALHALIQNMTPEAGSNSLQISIVKTIELITHDIRNWWLGYGLILAASGLVGLIVLRLTKVPDDKVIDLTVPALKITDRKTAIATATAHKHPTSPDTTPPAAPQPDPEAHTPPKGPPKIQL